MTSGIPLSEIQKQYIIENMDKKLGSEIARDLSISRSTVRKCIRNFGHKD